MGGEGGLTIAVRSMSRPRRAVVALARYSPRACRKGLDYDPMSSSSLPNVRGRCNSTAAMAVKAARTHLESHALLQQGHCRRLGQRNFRRLGSTSYGQVVPAAQLVTLDYWTTGCSGDETHCCISVTHVAPPSNYRWR